MEFLRAIRKERDGRLKDYRNRNMQIRTRAEIAFKHILREMQIPYEEEKIIKRGQTSGYIVDFYLPKHKIAIEVDGGYHEEIEQIIKDKKRTEYLEKKGIQVIRFKNIIVLNHPGKCLEIINKAIKERQINRVSGRSRKKGIIICKPYTEKDFKKDKRHYRTKRIIKMVKN